MTSVSSSRPENKQYNVSSSQSPATAKLGKTTHAALTTHMLIHTNAANALSHSCVLHLWQIIAASVTCFTVLDKGRITVPLYLKLHVI